MEADGGTALLGPVPVETVLATIRAATSHSNEEREPAEQMMRTWEADAAPGFLHSLMMIVQQPTIDEVRSTLIACRSLRSQLCLQHRALAAADSSDCDPAAVQRVRGVAKPLQPLDNPHTVALEALDEDALLSRCLRH